MPTENLPESAERYVPHRPPILMLRELIACDRETAEGIAWIPKVSPFHANGLLPRTFFVELLAQLVAAAQGYREAGEKTPPSGGYLVGIHEFDCCGDTQAGDSLHLYVRSMNQVEGLNILEGRVTRGDDLLAFGEFRCFLVSSFLPPSLPGAVSRDREWTDWSSLGDTIRQDMEIVSLNTAAGKAEANVCFAPNAPVFAGHFPDRPLVPGVVWLEVACALATNVLSRPIALRKIVSARFKSPVGPENTVRVALEVRSHNNETFVSSRVNAGKILAAAFELSLEYI